MSETGLLDVANTLVDDYGGRETVVGDVDDEIVDAIRGAVALRGVADDLLARLTAQAERVGVAKRAGMSLRELLCANGVAPSVASRLIRLGRAIQVLPRVARHSRDATLSAEHLDAVARGVEHVVRRTGEPVDSQAIGALEGTLIGHAVAGTAPAEIAERARAVAIELTTTEPADGEQDRMPPAEDTTLNELGWHTTDDGRLHGRFELDALTGERLITALDTASRPRPEPDGSEDARPASRRRADAFGQFLECGTRGLSPDALSGPPRTEVILTIPVGTGGDAEPGDAAARLGWMGPITDLSAKLLACDARLAGVGVDLNGAPISVTAPEPRLFTGAARKVVLYRDGCCIKCGAPASWCDVHHIVHHSDGGPTTVDNGCLLCRACHTAVHHSGWDIIMGADRHPWLIPPASVDPERTPLPAYNRRTMRLDDPIAA